MRRSHLSDHVGTGGAWLKRWSTRGCVKPTPRTRSASVDACLARLNHRKEIVASSYALAEAACIDPRAIAEAQIALNDTKGAIASVRTGGISTKSGPAACTIGFPNEKNKNNSDYYYAYVGYAILMPGHGPTAVPKQM